MKKHLSFLIFTNLLLYSFKAFPMIERFPTEYRDSNSESTSEEHDNTPDSPSNNNRKNIKKIKIPAKNLPPETNMIITGNFIPKDNSDDTDVSTCRSNYSDHLESSDYTDYPDLNTSYSCNKKTCTIGTLVCFLGLSTCCLGSSIVLSTCCLAPSICCLNLTNLLSMTHP